MPQGMRNGFPVHWTEWGNGPRDALMLHCTLAHAGAWTGVAAGLSEMCSITAFDLPGHGRSGPWDGRAPLQAFCAEIAAEFCTGPMDVIGHSFGGTIGLRLALTRPDLVRTLTLIEPVFFAILRNPDGSVTTGDGDEVRAFERLLDTGDPQGSARLFTEYWEGASGWARLSPEQQRRRAEQMPVIHAGTDEIWNDSARQLAPGVLETVTCPVLLLEGAKSPPNVSHINDRLAARLPRATRAVVGGAAHLLPITHAAPVATEIAAFLRANPA